ncbi:MAG: hypothetical protein A3F84_27315 [Candidatus Handelsmanbacteria bacterium RIFCSPLOWO2_12_FULL_64_10]|uniref:Oxidoreductase n=1 Tax=Handelsmanbacteria sp. (strain RIFCSPLOWO2_12_FULL_64_10) TaxID=1817868 RepID=A0A1F6C3R1_HANXR|nr:MAG: hypothetical protein A3F84_27315 [Candidatus Handelsmanbacteria bacterium RIFCSPLOWO2_12_FULL_64_10]
MTKRRCLMIGAGGMAGAWIRRFYPNFRDRAEIVGLVDIKPDILKDAGDFLNLPPSRRFTDLRAAFQAVDADYCTIVIPPAAHRDAVTLAVERKMDIFSEKPIADTWDACVDIYRAVKRAGLRMLVIQNYRYTPRMLTMREVLRSGRLGRINYLMGRFAADYRKYGAWGAFRHEIPHSLLVEGAVHHFDMLRNLSGADCKTVAGWEWNPAWSSFKGECNNLYVLTMSNGVRACYEGSGTGAGVQNSWHKEYYRAECEGGAVAVGRDDVVRVYEHRAGQGMRIEEVPSVRPAHEGHNHLIHEWLNWLDGGPPPDTVLDDNLKSVATVFGAIEASRTNSVVDVEKMVAEVTL